MKPVVCSWAFQPISPPPWAVPQKSTSHQQPQLTLVAWGPPSLSPQVPALLIVVGKCLPLLLSSVAQPIHQIQKSISSLVTMPRLIFSMGISRYHHPSRQPHACSTKQGYAHMRRMSPKEENEINTDAGILCNGGAVEHTRSGAHCPHIAVGRQMSHSCILCS